MRNVDVLVVGASVAGVATVEELRRKGFAGTVALMDAEEHLPYDKPPLSKKALTADWDLAQAQLRPRGHYESLSIDLLLGSPGRSLDAGARCVTTASGQTYGARHVVIATGARPRTLPGCSVAAVRTLRGLDDAVAIRESLAPGRHLVVVGGGFIGAEVAATAREQGVDVTLVEAIPEPFSAVLGRDVGAALASAHRRRGVRVRCGVPVAAIEERDGSLIVELADHSVLQADAVVVGLGVRPNTEWLDDSGLRLADGVVCDAAGRTSATGVYAAGDVASWLDVRSGSHLRSEHWTTAREHGSQVASTIMGDPEVSSAVSAVPYFWSDQFGLRLQCYGRPAGHDQCELVWGSFADERFVVVYRRQGVAVAVVGINAAREVRRYRAEIERGQVEPGQFGPQPTAIGPASVPAQ